MQLGLDGPETYAERDRLIAITGRVAQYAKSRPLPQAGSILDGLDKDLSPGCPIDLYTSMLGSVYTAQTCLVQVVALLGEEDFVHLLPMMSLTRSALLGGGRVVYALGSDDPATRRSNSLVVLKQESRSYAKTIKALRKEVLHLHTLRPPEELANRVAADDKALRRGDNPPGDEKVLRQMAEFIGTLLHAQDPETPAQIATETLLWVWNTYSGAAHGQGWVNSIAGGEFITDLSFVTSVVHFACDIFERRCSVDTAVADS